MDLLSTFNQRVVSQQPSGFELTGGPKYMGWRGGRSRHQQEGAMITTRRIPIFLEAVGLCPGPSEKEAPGRTGKSAMLSRQSLIYVFRWAMLGWMIWFSVEKSVAQQNWLVPLRPETIRRPAPPELARVPNASENGSIPDHSEEKEIRGAFGFALGEKVDPRFKLYHDSHEKDLPYYKITPELTLTEKISIDYRVLLTPGEKRVALIRAKCILESFHDVRSFSQRIQELILTKYGKGTQHIQPTKFGRKWYYSKSKQPTVSISIEADSTTGIVYIQYSDEALVSEIRRDVWEKRVGKFNLSAL